MRFEREDGRRSHAVVLRFGSSLTGVGLGGVLLYFFGQDRAFTGWAHPVTTYRRNDERAPAVRAP